MLPYKKEDKVVIDPNLKGKLHFGSVPDELIEKNIIGTIKEDKYIHKLLCNCYGVQFPGHKKLFWFKERELT